jgi:hypothetical protein
MAVEGGKKAIPEITAYSIAQWLLTTNAPLPAVPSIGNSMYATFFMLAKRIGCRAQGECAQFMKRLFFQD